MIYLGSQTEDFTSIVQHILQQPGVFSFQQIKSIDQLLDTTFAPEAKLFLIDGRLGSQAATEWVQSVKMSAPNIFVCVLNSAEVPVDFAVLKKNGADRIMHLLYDQEFIQEFLMELAIHADSEGDPPLAALNNIALEDLDQELEINFDLFIHFPGNKKTILARKKGAKLDHRFLKKADETKQTLYVAKKDLKGFFEYARTVQSSRNVANPVSLTEKFLKTKKVIHEMMASFLDDRSADFQDGKKILESCISILNDFELLKETSPKQAYENMKRLAGRPRTLYHDAICTGCYAAMIGWILKLPPTQIESLAIAGLLHNIGLSQLPSSTIMKDISDYTPDELKIYHSYPENSVNMVKSKKVSLKPEVAQAILEHRENANGTGFPRKLQSQDTDALAKLSRLALRVQELTALNTDSTQTKNRSMPMDQVLTFIRDETLSGSNPLHDVITVTNLIQNLSR